MIRVTIILICVFGLVAVGASFLLSIQDNPRYSWLQEHRGTVALVALAGLVGQQLFTAIKDWSQHAANKAAPIILVLDPKSGNRIPQATLAGFEKELKESAAELEEESRDYFDVGQRHLDAQQYEQATINFQKSLDALPTLSAYLNLGNSFLAISNFREAEDAWVRGSRIAKARGNKDFEAAFSGSIGFVEKTKGNLQEALQAHEEALELYREIGDRHNEANALGNIGSVYNKFGDVDKAIEFHSAAIKIDRGIRNREGEAAALLALGNCYIHSMQLAGETATRNLEKGKDSIERSLKLFRRLGDRIGEGQALLSQATIYDFAGRPKEESGRILKEALSVFREVGSAQGEAAALGNLGGILMDQQRFEDALESLNAALKLEQRIGDPYSQASTLIAIAHCLGQSNKAAEALRVLDQINTLPLDGPEYARLCGLMEEVRSSLNAEPA